MSNEEKATTNELPEGFDTTNRFLVTSHNDRVMLMTIAGMRTYSKAEALSLVAWVIVMGDIDAADVDAAVRAVRST